MEPEDLTPEEVAAALELTLEQTWHLARNIETYYKPSRVEIRNGKSREIDPPTRFLKASLRRLHRFFQERFRFHPCAHGAVRGHSSFTSARHHCGRRVILKRDYKDCYPSITRDMLLQGLLRYGFRSATADLLSRLMTVRGRLPQGSPVSGDGLNFFLYQFDHVLAAGAAKLGARYTRLEDDLICSTDDPTAAEPLGALMEQQSRAVGLKINERKKEVGGLQRAGGRQLVHNLVVNRGRGVAIPREQRESALRVGYSYVRSARCVTPDGLETLARKREKLAGYLYYCRQAQFGPARHLRKLLDSGDRLVEQRLTHLGLAAQRKKWWVLRGRRKTNRPRQIARLWRQRLDQERALDTRPQGPQLAS